MSPTQFHNNVSYPFAFRLPHQHTLLVDPDGSFDTVGKRRFLRQQALDFLSAQKTGIGRACKDALKKASQILLVEGKASITRTVGVYNGKVIGKRIIEKHPRRDVIASFRWPSAVYAVTHQTVIDSQLSRVHSSLDLVEG
jgi:hypothetical protein